MNSVIITIGDELLIGQVINTNQAFIAEQLNSIGVNVLRMETVGDVKEEILASFTKAWNDAEIILTTGGLGPTHDDITRECICSFFGTSLVMNEKALENVRSIISKRKVQMTKMNEEQALVPLNATVIQNSCGTAPGSLFERDGKYFFTMPGVPKEMKAMMENFINPTLAKKVSGSVIRHRTLKTVGVVEAHLAERLGDIQELFCGHTGTTLAFLPEIFAVRLRISVKDTSSVKAEQQVQKVEKVIREKVGEHIFGVDDETLEEVTGNLLREHNQTIAIAESCTGGRILDKLTNISGSSDYVERGVVSYSNKSKTELLGVDEKLIKEFGAVSREVAEAMATGVRKIANTSIGISITGIAGPSGGTPEKPVGLVWLGYSTEKETVSQKYYLGDGRKEVKERASLAALEFLRKKLLMLI